MSHFIKQCKHGVIESRCRCTGPHDIQTVPCMTSHLGVLLHDQCREKNTTILDELRAAGEDYDDVLEDRDLEPIKTDFLSKHRWYNRVREVYQDGDFYFAVEYSEPATEYQEGQDTNPTFYEVTRVTKTVVDYIPIAKAL